ncbi:baculoviral IAP repeat-containing protein 6 isoform X1, partial [Tachysurus ichikawai]
MGLFYAENRGDDPSASTSSSEDELVRHKAKPGGRVRCQYFPVVDKVLFVDDYAVGCRKDLNGILLLDTALQAPVDKPEDMVQLELPVTEVSEPYASEKSW